jgi:phosphatidylglycerol---prolipoprotein diacylglyceryl transferase
MVAATTVAATMEPVLAGISYTTFPIIEIGPLHLRTFGLMVGIGVLLGAWLAARRLEAHGIEREDTYRLAMRLVIGGMIGARLTWDVSHWSQIESPLDLIAVWKGGLQFSGGFVAAVIAGYPEFQKLSPRLRWRTIDSYCYGLVIGLAFGRVGCYSVGEHFGRTTSFFLGTTFRGGSTREPATIGETFHQTALYEMLFLIVLFLVFTALIKATNDQLRPGTMIGVFCLAYGTFRFGTETLRVNDERVLGLTGAQYLMLSLIPAGIWILTRVRPRIAALEATPEPEPAEPADL